VNSGTQKRLGGFDIQRCGNFSSVADFRMAEFHFERRLCSKVG